MVGAAEASDSKLSPPSRPSSPWRTENGRLRLPLRPAAGARALICTGSHGGKGTQSLQERFPSAEVSLKSSLGLAPLGPFLKNSRKEKARLGGGGQTTAEFLGAPDTWSHGRFSSERLRDPSMTCRSTGRRGWCSSGPGDPLDSTAHFPTAALHL